MLQGMYLLELVFCLYICSGVCLLDHTVVTFWSFSGTFILFSMMIVNPNSCWQYRWVPFSPHHVQHQMKLLIKISVYTFFHLQSFGLGKSNQAQWTSIFLKKDSFSSEIIFVLLIWKFLQTRWEFHLGAKRGHIVENLKITIKLRRKWSALQNHHAALILSFISDLTLLPTSMAPPSLLTYYTTASNGAKHWASEIVKNWVSLLEKEAEEMDVHPDKIISILKESGFSKRLVTECDLASLVSMLSPPATTDQLLPVELLGNWLPEMLAWVKTGKLMTQV